MSPRPMVRGRGWNESGAAGLQPRCAVQSRHDTVLPRGTFTLNITGSLILGLLTGVLTAGTASPHAQLLIGTGLCGGLSTYSTFLYETLRLAEDGVGFLVAANAVGSVVAVLGAAFTGGALAQALWG